MKFKGIVALVLSLLLAFGAVVFTASADNSAEAVTIEVSEDMENAQSAELNTKYFVELPTDPEAKFRSYIKVNAEEVDGYYSFNFKNIADEADLHLYITDETGKDITESFSVLSGEEKSLSVRLEANKVYYIKLNNFNDAEEKAYFDITYTADPEPNEKKSKISVPSNEFYEGNLATPEDEDWVCLGEYNTKKYRLLLESREEGQELMAMVYTYSSYKETVDLICGETSDAVEIPTSSTNERYYIWVTGIGDSCGDYAIRLEELVTVTPENDRTLNSVKFINSYNGTYDYSMMKTAEFGRNYVTYVDDNTWVKDARHIFVKTDGDNCKYELWAKNEDIPTETGNAVVEIVENRSTGEPVITRMELELGSEQTTTFDLAPYEYYYLKFYTLDEDTRPGGLIKFRVSKVQEPEETETTTETETSEATSTVTEATEATEVTTITASTEPSETIPAVTTEPTEATTVTVTATEATEVTESEPVSSEATDATQATTEAKEQVMLGDTDLNGKINIKDATLIQKALAKLLALDDTQNTASDVTEDGKVNIKDATAIQKYIAKIETPYKTGQLILSEVEYSEPAPEATTPTEIITTTATESTEVPVTTAIPETGPTEAPVTTTVTEPVETTEVTVPETTASEEVTEPEPTETLSQLDTLKALNEEAKALLEGNKAYADELPLEEDSAEMNIKKELGYYDFMGENLDVNEYEKLSTLSKNVGSYLDRGYQFSDDHSEYINKITKAIEWFEHYVNEVHSTPALLPKTIYFKNTLGWKYVNIYCWNENGDEMDWPGVEMTQLDKDYYTYEVASEFTNIIFNTTEKDGQYSVEIDLTEHESYTVFELTEEFENGYKYKAFVYEIPYDTLA